jgi:hypothetical protein
MAPFWSADANSPLVGGVIVPLAVGSWKTNHSPPGCRFMTVFCVPSAMSTPVGFEGAGTSP